MKNHSFKLLAFSFILAVCFSFSFSNLSRADACLPTCATNDSRFLTFGGQGIDTFVFENLIFGVGSPAGADTLHIKIFDGDTNGQWDWNNANHDIHLTFRLFADPMGDASGTVALGTWTSDGSGGLNMGSPMPDNDFFDIIIPNAPEAMAESGNYLYTLEAQNADTSLRYLVYFKLQVIGDNTSLSIFPGDQPFGFEATYRSLLGSDFGEAFETIYPRFASYPACDDIPGCYDDPECCLFSTYDGTYDFYFINSNEGRQVLKMWDGDLDYGFNGQAPPFDDTDDPNTPPGIPVFADPINTNPQGSARGTDNISDICDVCTYVRLPDNMLPNITYELIDPNGVSYLNDNPSGSGEWELFSLSTEPGCAPDICDHEVDEIPTGIWHMRISGQDMWNVTFIRAFDQFIGVDPGGDPVMPLSPDAPPPSTVPTFSEWGMFAVVLFLGIIGLYHLRRRKNLEKI